MSIHRDLVNYIEAILDDRLESSSLPSESTWNVVREVAGRSSKRQWTAFLVGGALRDMAFGAVGTKPRDIDIVFCGIHLDEIANEFSDFGFVRRTSFGGLRYKCQDVFLDVWPLEKTYVVKPKSEQVSIQDVPRHAFLNIEAIAIEISKIKGTERRVVESGFSEAVKQSKLEINFENNPFPEICVLRAFRSSIVLNLSMGARFIKFVRNRQWDMNALLQAQDAHYETPFFSKALLEDIFTIILRWNREKNGTDRLSLNAELKRRHGSYDPVAELPNLYR